MAENGLDIAIIGATGAAGSDIITALERSSLPVARWILVASATKAHLSVDIKGRSVPVLPGPPHRLPQVVLDEADLIIMATPAAVTRTLAPAAIEAGIAIIDMSGALSDQGPMAVPLAGISINDEGFQAARVVCSPSAPTVLAATVLRPLAALGLVRANMVCLLPAGMVGQAGAEELSRQVVALFNSADPPRNLFPTGLAFDILGAVGEPADDWTGAERRVSAELGGLLRLPPPRLPVTLTMAPTFSGISIAFHVQLQGDASAAQVRSALEAMPMVRLEDPVTSPKDAMGTAVAHVGRLRDDPGGAGVHLWAVADNLRYCASANAVALALHLWRNDLL